jgi:hypothetical protein
MLDLITSDQQMIWLIVAFFYILDNLKFLRGNQVVLQETAMLRWRADIPGTASEFLGRKVFVLNLLVPYGMAVQLGWLSLGSPNDQELVRRADRLVRIACGKILPLRQISAFAFLTFFIAGPILTHYVGLGRALVTIIPVYITLLLIFFISMAQGRRFWKLSVAQIGSLTFGAAICPGYLVNSTRRVTWDFLKLPVDGAAYGLLRCNPAYADRLGAALDFALDEFRERCVDNPEEMERLDSYRKSVMK